MSGACCQNQKVLEREIKEKYNNIQNSVFIDNKLSGKKKREKIENFFLIQKIVFWFLGRETDNISRCKALKIYHKQQLRNCVYNGQTNKLHIT